MRRLFVMALTAAASSWAGIGQWTSLGPDGGFASSLVVDPHNPGGDAFGAFCVNGSLGSIEGRGIAWMVQRLGADAELVVATRFGARIVASFEELLAALDVIGEPIAFPYTDWPGVTVSAIA